MLTRTLHTTWITRFFVLIYLLISVTPVNASFWCQKAESTSHLELNPAGECWVVAPLEEDGDGDQCCEEVPKPGVSLSVQGKSCFDYPAYSSVLTPSNRTTPLSKIVTTDITLTALHFISFKDSGAVRSANLTLASQLPRAQFLTAIRTVILLH